MMKKDKLEELVRKHRQEFDHLQPPDDLWERIVAGLDGKPRKAAWDFWRVAAVFFFLATLGLLTARFWQPAAGDAAAHPELTEAEQYYTRLIEDRATTLAAYLEEYPGLATEFTDDWQELEDNYVALKDEYAHTRNSEVLAAIIENLRLQQELLNRQLEVIMSIKKQENDEKVSI